MPTNILRKSSKPKQRSVAPVKPAGGARRARLTAGRVTLDLDLMNTVTADLIWRIMPIYSIVETWGDSIHFECPVRAGRERTARLNVQPGDVCYWSEDDRVMLGWGPTPISRPTEIRLMRPCNIWARTVGDPDVLAKVTPGEKASLLRLER